MQCGWAVLQWGQPPNLQRGHHSTQHHRAGRQRSAGRKHSDWRHVTGARVQLQIRGRRCADADAGRKQINVNESIYVLNRPGLVTVGGMVSNSRMRFGDDDDEMNIYI